MCDHHDLRDRRVAMYEIDISLEIAMVKSELWGCYHRMQSLVLSVGGESQNFYIP